MTEYELHQLIGQLKEQAQKAEQLGIINELAVIERKIVMAKAYLLNPEDFKQGEIYEIEGIPGSVFKIDDLHGVFAWGYQLNEQAPEEEAFPISMLKSIK